MKKAHIVGRRGDGRTRRSAMIGVLLGAAGLAACGVSAREPAPQRHVIEMDGFAFRPQALHVAVGDTVVWLNRDVVPHTATDSAGGWDSGSVPAGGSWSLVAGEVGSATYLCTLHPTMTATLIVE